MIGREEKAAVMRVMERGILSGYKGNWSDAFLGGPEIQALEREWAEYFGVKHAIACNSATSGLWMALAAIGIKPGDECIVSCYSMTCSASIPLHFGAKPVFADIEPDYYCLDVKSIEERITNKTKAIIVVDIFGQCYDAEAINEIAEHKGKEYGHKIYVIEDAAQAAGAKYKGKYAGALGDIGIYSLNVHKPIQCGEGGVVVTNDDKIAFRLRLAMNHAEAVNNDLDKQPVIEDNNYEMVGMNLRMIELSAAIAREQLKKLEGILQIVREHAKCFDVKIRENCESSFYRYAWNGETTPEAQREMQNENSIFNFKKHYVKPIYKMPLFKSLGYKDGLCPVCEETDKNIVLAWLKETP